MPARLPTEAELTLELTKREREATKATEFKAPTSLWGALALLLVWFAQVQTQADRAANWRVFRQADGLQESAVNTLSMSPRGNLRIKHAASDQISLYDGYEFHSEPAHDRNAFRVYESRSGQRWSLYTNGLVLFDGARWVEFPVPEIRDEIRKDPLRQIRQITLVPAERDHVLFLVSDRLMEFDATTARAILYRHVQDTKLERFYEMVEARDGGLWISGSKGLAYLPGPIRRIAPSTPWKEYVLETASGIDNLQRPFESDLGITTLANSLASAGKRVVVQFNGEEWSHHPPIPEMLRQAWTGWDKTLWGFSINALIRFDRLHPGRFTKEGTWLGQFKDVLVETNGVFWLGTTEGLVRYAPNLWRTPDEVDEFRALVHSMAEDKSGAVWFCSTDGLAELRNGHWKVFRWPEGFEATFNSGDGLCALEDGRLVIASGETPIVFQPSTGEFKNLAHPDGKRMRLIGQLKNGHLCLQTTGSENGNIARRIELFGGASFQVWGPVNERWPPEQELRFLYTAANGDVWLGGMGGVLLAREETVRFFPTGAAFRDEQAFCATDAGDGKIWCGGAGRILEFNGVKWKVLRGGLDRVTSLTRGRDGKIWAGTNRGLHVFHDGNWISHGLEEGLPGASVAALLEDRTGRLWAGTTRGISLFHPEADLDFPRTLDPSVISPSRPSTDGSVSISLNAVDRWQNTAVDRLLFSTRLNEGPWSTFTNSPLHSFQNLGSGKHRLEVRAMDRNWNTDPLTRAIEFTIMLPWYREPRLVAVTASGFLLVLFFAGLAVNRHLRLIRSYAEVEKIVALRTRELEKANEELLHSQKMKALGTLAAGIAHDFNNILSIIKGSAQLIEKDSEDVDKIRNRVARIKMVVEQGSGIVRSMLGLRLTSPREYVECDLVALAEEAARLLTERFPAQITVKVEPPSETLPKIFTSRELLHQMLHNLVLNAVDAMNGSGTVTLRVGRVHSMPQPLALPPRPAIEHLFLVVEDHGCGIAQDVLPRIFEPFFTTKAMSSRRGTGLGLSMVYELAKELGYGLHVQSAPGTGTVFSIILPAGSESPEQSP